MSDVLPERPAKSPPTVFFSYSRADQRRALPIIHALEAAGYSVWWDGLLEAGSIYLAATEQALEAAKAVVVLWSETSVQSHWVQDEAMSGRRSSRMVPLSIQNATPPLGFRQFQVIDFERWRGKSDAPELAEMLRAVAALHGTTPSLPVSAPLNIAASLSRRKLLAGSAAGAAAALVGAAAWQTLFNSKGSLAGNGVVVMPFANLSVDAALNYISSGLASEIRASLARNPALRVVGETSSQALADQKLDAVAAAQRLNVSWLLEGVLSVDNGIATLTVSLNSGKTGFQEWTETFESTLENLLALRDSVASKIVSKLTAEVSGAEDASKSGATKSATAFNDYLKGQALYGLSKDTETDLAALAHFDAAIMADPAFGLAYAARAKSLTVLGNGASSVDAARTYYDDAVLAAVEAVRLGPELADAHSTLGFVLFQAKLKVKDARKPYETSRDLGQGEASVLARFAAYCASVGRHGEALAAVTRALDLDPFNAALHRARGFVHFANRDYRKSIINVEQALKLNPELGDSHARIGMALVHMDQPAEALKACGAERSALVRYPCMAIGFNRTKNQAAAAESMSALLRDYGDSGLYQQAQILSQWGELDSAMTRLRAAYAVGDSGLTYLAMDPALDPLRARPDFSELLDALGFDRVQ